MRDVTARGRDEAEESPFPWAGVLLSALAVLSMLGVSAALWPDLPVRAPGDVAFGGGGSGPPRLLMAVAVPGVAAMIVGCVSLGRFLGPAVDRGLGLARHRSGRADRALTNAFLVLIAVFLLATHTVLLHTEAGREPFLPLERLMALLTAGLLVGFGSLVGLLRTPAGKDHVVQRWWDRARRPVGGAVAAVGVLVGAAGALLPAAVHAAPLVGLLAPAIALGCAVPFLGDQSWRNGRESDS